MNDFRVERYADFGTGEPWVARLMIGLQELVFAIPAYVSTRDEFMNELGSVFDALGKAFEELRSLRQLVASATPVLNLVGTYESFYGHLWRAYKGRFQKTMKALGLDIGFLFQSDNGFERGAAKLLDSHPELVDLVGLMRRDRSEFQTRLSKYRNDYLEHQVAHPDPVMIAEFHRLDSAENMFENVWEAIEDYVALYTLANCPSGVGIEIPENERNPVRPTRFRFTISGLPPSQ